MDGDVVAYEMASHYEVATEVEPGYWTWFCDFNKVKEAVHSRLKYFLTELKADSYVLVLSDVKNFRKDILPSYKGNRSNLKKPLVLKQTREWMQQELGALLWPNLEGDDVLGILSTEETDEERIIISIDKDMKTIPGLLVSPRVSLDIITITEKEADYYHLYQTLIGDNTDGYKGCPSIGPVAATRILNRNPSWNAVVRTYATMKIYDEEVLTQARCARILRASDWDYENKVPILWTP